MGVEIKSRKALMLSIRTSNELRQKLNDATEASGRTLTQEVEMRLERSFLRDEFTGGSRTTAFLDAVGALIRELEIERNTSWTSDGETWREVEGLIKKLLEERRPNTSSAKGN